MTKGDQQGIGKMVFCGKNCISDSAASTLWWYPPTIQASTKPNPESYVLWRLFLWMQWRAWLVDLKCFHCPEHSLQ